MKLLTFEYQGKIRLGALKNDRIIDLADAAQAQGQLLPDNMANFLAHQMDHWMNAQQVIQNAQLDADYCIEPDAILAPVPHPTSLRDGYAFRQHVEAARRNRGAEMVPEYDEFPVFYFSNHNAISGPGEILVQEDHLNRLDFELECAVVIGRAGRNIAAAEADEYIAGYTIMNDFSARALQMQEMKLNLGPAKGKDFATAIGPYLVTRDELERNRIDSPDGERHNLTMTAEVNGIEVSRDNLKNMHWTFAQIIERASYGVTLFPGDVIGSGTCGTGCFLELNGSGITDNQWLLDGDTVTLSIEGLGKLTNQIKLVK